MEAALLSKINKALAIA